MPEKNYVASTDLISRILHPIQRSLDEAMGTMGRSMDPDRLEESEKQQDRSSSRVPGTLSHGETASTVNDRAKPKSPAPLIHEKALDSRKSKNGTVYTEREALNTGAVIESDMVPSRLRSDSPPVIDQLRSPKKQEKPLSDRVHRSGRSVSGPLYDESQQAVPPQTDAELDPSEAVKTRPSKTMALGATSVPGERKGRPLESPTDSINVHQVASVPVVDSTDPGDIEHTAKIESWPKITPKTAMMQRQPVGAPLPAAPVSRSDAPEGADPPGRQPESVTHPDSIKASGTAPAVSPADMPALHRVQAAMRSTTGDMDSAQPAIETKPEPGPTESLQAPAPSSSQPARVIPLTRPLQRAADHVAAGMEPVLDQAYGVTRQSLEAEQKPATEGADSAPVSRVNNTFNVNVSMSTGQGMTVEQREALKDALIEILRSAARRHGLEV